MSRPHRASARLMASRLPLRRRSLFVTNFPPLLVGTTDSPAEATPARAFCNRVFPYPLRPGFNPLVAHDELLASGQEVWVPLVHLSLDDEVSLLRAEAPRQPSAAQQSAHRSHSSMFGAAP